MTKRPSDVRKWSVEPNEQMDKGHLEVRPMKSRWVWLCGAGVITVVLLVVGLIDQNERYVPLAAAVVSGTATLIGVVVGALVLRFQHRSQGNPLKVEASKKQCEAIVNFVQHCLKIEMLFRRWQRSRQDTEKYSVAFRQVTKEMNALRGFHFQVMLLANSRLLVNANQCMSSALAVTEVDNEDLEAWNAAIEAPYGEYTKAVLHFVWTAKQVMTVDSLTEGAGELGSWSEQEQSRYYSEITKRMDRATK